MIDIRPLCLATLAVVLGLTGCSSNSFESRSTEFASVYDPQSFGTQQRLKHGIIQTGDTPEMVYVALGKPDDKRDVLSGAGYQSVWVYKNRHPKIKDREATGWSEVLVPGSTDQNDKVTQEPITKEVYRTQSSAGLRVGFAGGVVNSVELLKR